jgi:hypothetical protein
MERLWSGVRSLLNVLPAHDYSRDLDRIKARNTRRRKKVLASHNEK